MLKYFQEPLSKFVLVRLTATVGIIKNPTLGRDFKSRANMARKRTEM